MAEKSGAHILPDVNVKNWNRGLITRLESQSIPRGAASDALNWFSQGDHIELRGGRALMGTEITTNGKISGLKVGVRFDGVQVPFRVYDQKQGYYDTVTEDWIDAAVFPITVLDDDGNCEDISFSTYHSLAGAYLYGSSPNSSIYKTPIANPASVVDQLSTAHRGKIRIKQARMFLWDRKDTTGGSDKNGVYLSYIDRDELSDYTPVTAEAIGALGSTTYSGTLAFKAGDAKRTCMYVSFTATTAAGTELFIDDRNGSLSSAAGGTGTINYATGAYSITFSQITTGAVTSDYYWENAVSAGICDFSKSNPRTAGQGAVFRQDEGGAEMQNMGTIGEDEFCFHRIKTWNLFLSSDDTDATNLVYRVRVGLPYWQALEETGEGIIYADAIDVNDPLIRIMQKSQFSTEVLPASLSDNLLLKDYRFDKCVIKEWGSYYVVVCRHVTSTINNRMLMYNKIWKTWDIMDLRASYIDEYNSSLIAGDSGSKNVFTLFSGVSDEDANIPNQWTTGKDNLGSEGVKYSNVFEIAGLVGPDQKLKISLAYDSSDFVEVGFTEIVDGDDDHQYAIEGTGTYVDQSQSAVIGGPVIGSTMIGGGELGLNASPYRRQFRINTPIFEFVRVKFEAVGVGYMSITEYSFRDNRFKGRALPPQYVVN